MYYLRIWKIGVRITFGFSLYTALLQVILVIYFGKVLGGLRDWSPLEGGEMCHHQQSFGWFSE